MKQALPSWQTALRPLGLGIVLTVPLASGCTPYERHSDEYLAGSVDPVKFPAAYLGDGGDPKKPGGGVFKYVAAHVLDKAVSYYPLPFSSTQTSGTDPLAVDGLTLPLAYIFDPLSSGPDGAAADSTRCTKPDGYVYDDVDRREQAVRQDRQGNIFTLLPTASYVPIVREVVVTSNGNLCQAIKSEATLLTRTDVTLSLAPPTAPTPDAPPRARPSGRLLAMAIIDPAADVQLADPAHPYDPTTMLGPQRWGYYSQYLLAYLDGGYLPQQLIYGPKDPAGTQRIVAQDLYYPTKVVDGKGAVGPGELGLGFDVLQFRRGQDGYSPVCRVLSFDPKDPKTPETSVSAIDPATVTDTGRYIYCLQLP